MQTIIKVCKLHSCCHYNIEWQLYKIGYPPPRTTAKSFFVSQLRTLKFLCKGHGKPGESRDIPDPSLSRPIPWRPSRGARPVAPTAPRPPRRAHLAAPTAPRPPHGDHLHTSRGVKSGKESVNVSSLGNRNPLPWARLANNIIDTQ